MSFITLELLALIIFTTWAAIFHFREILSTFPQPGIQLIASLNLWNGDWTYLLLTYFGSLVPRTQSITVINLRLTYWYRAIIPTLRQLKKKQYFSEYDTSLNDILRSCLSKNGQQQQKCSNDILKVDEIWGTVSCSLFINTKKLVIKQGIINKSI